MRFITEQLSFAWLWLKGPWSDVTSCCAVSEEPWGRKLRLAVKKHTNRSGQACYWGWWVLRYALNNIKRLKSRDDKQCSSSSYVMFYQHLILCQPKAISTKQYIHFLHCVIHIVCAVLCCLLCIFTQSACEEHWPVSCLPSLAGLHATLGQKISEHRQPLWLWQGQSSFHIVLSFVIIFHPHNEILLIISLRLIYAVNGYRPPSIWSRKGCGLC